MTLAASSGKHNVTVWRLSVCPVFFLTLLQRAAHTKRDSPGVSMRRGQHTFSPDNKQDRHTSLLLNLAYTFVQCIL